jgi:hypothetical protein
MAAISKLWTTVNEISHHPECAKMTREGWNGLGKTATEQELPLKDV